jgi:GT2 family glycosyltransferase
LGATSKRRFAAKPRTRHRVRQSGLRYSRGGRETTRFKHRRRTANRMTNSPFIWIVVLNWNGLSDTLACLESLRHLRYAKRRVVVVDNGSTDGSVAGLRPATRAPDVEIIEAGRNLGYAGGNNLGIRYALERGADFILVLNNDTTVAPMLLDELIAAAERDPGAGCFGPWIFYMDDPEQLWCTRTEWTPTTAAFNAPDKGRLVGELVRDSTRTEYVCGAALFFRARVAQQIGLLDERFFLVYEDADWGFRARQAGFECVTVPSAHVWHKIGTSFGSEASPLRTYFSIRNKLLWAEKHVSRREWWGILRVALGRLYPVLRMDSAVAGSMHKALLWALDGYLREWSRRFKDPQEVAHRRGVLDYVFRRFGDCPPRIRVLTQIWATSHDTTADRGRLAS